jgi:hypothetical protein
VEHIEVASGVTASAERVGESVEAAASAEGLVVRMRTTLRRYPESLHWHLARLGERGTLEVTYWPPAGRLWLSVQSGRRAAWIAEVVPGLRRRIQQGLDG